MHLLPLNRTRSLESTTLLPLGTTQPSIKLFTKADSGPSNILCADIWKRAEIIKGSPCLIASPFLHLDSGVAVEEISFLQYLVSVPDSEEASTTVSRQWRPGTSAVFGSSLFETQGTGSVL